MCGICGIYTYQSEEPVDPALIQRMNSAITHRGPDDEGIYNTGACSIAMRRLSIIDLAGGHQPLANEDETIWIVFNGEIYNFKELRSELEQRGHRFRTRSDTEVIVHAYEEWGCEAFQRLNGMFGLAIWDGVRRRLVLARDHFGVKPLYYYDDGQRLVFGSELKAILQDSAVPRRVDEVALNQYLTFRFVPAPRTLMEGIGKLPPGHYLVCSPDGCNLRRYFVTPPASLHMADEQELIEELRHHLHTAIRRQMVSDVPVGALLSGGVDSTTIVTLMQQEAREPIHTFTVGFADQGDFNELAYARETARRLGTHHHEVVLTSQDYRGFWPKAMWHLEEPVVTPSVLPMYFVSKLAREYVKVVLTGQGADEPWAGYRRYAGEQLAGAYQQIPEFLRQGIVAPLIEVLPRSEGLKRAVRSLGTTDPAERFARVYAVFSPRQKLALYANGMARYVGREVESVRFWQREVAHLEGLAQMMYVDARFSLADDLLLYGDKMSMAVSLEARVPMLDLELMAFVESLPANLRLHGRTHKYLYRKAIAGWLPQEVLQRPKRGFDTPLDQWLSGDLQSYARRLWSGPDAACQNYFRPAYLDQLLQEHASRRADHRRQIYCLLSFAIWHRLFIEGQTIEEIPV